MCESEGSFCYPVGGRRRVRIQECKERQVSLTLACAIDTGFDCCCGRPGG